MLAYLTNPFIQIIDTNGTPVVGAKIYVYNADTTNLATTYSDFDGNQNTNPVIADELGNATIIADDGFVYDIEIKDADDVLLFGKKYITPGEGGVSVSGCIVSAGNGIIVNQSVQNNKTVFTVQIDNAIIPTFSDLSAYQQNLSAGRNIEFSGNTVNLANTVIINDSANEHRITKSTDRIENTTAHNVNLQNAVQNIITDNNGYSNDMRAGSNAISYGTDINTSEATANMVSSYNSGKNTYSRQTYNSFIVNSASTTSPYLGTSAKITPEDVKVINRVPSGEVVYSLTALQNAVDNIHPYSAGPNIDITSNIISGKDWTPELSEKLDASAYHPADSMHAGTDLIITPLNVIQVDTDGVTSGNKNFVMNRNTSAIGDYNLVGGLNSSGFGISNLVFGTNNKLSANDAVVVGKDNTVKNDNYGFVAGSGNTVSGVHNDVVGAYNNVVAVSSNIYGIGNTVNADSYFDGWDYSANVNVNVLGKNNVLKNIDNKGNSEIIIGENNINSAEITSAHNAYSNTLIGKDNKLIRSTSAYSYSNKVFGEGNILSGDRFTYNTVDGYYNNLSSTNGIDYSTLLGAENIVRGRVGYFQLIGYQNKISGNRVFENVLIGTQNEIKNDSINNDLNYSTVVGHNNILTTPASATDVGYDNTLIGYGNKVNSWTNVAVGIDNTIDGKYAVAFGYHNEIRQAKSSTGSDEYYNNMTFGEMNQVSGERCSCLGIGNSARGIRTICYGDSNYGFGSYQELHGFDNKISGNYNTVMGFDNSANTIFYCNVIGSGNNLPNYNSGCTFVGDNNDIDRGHDHFVIGSDNDFDYDSQKIKMLGTNNVVSAHEIAIIGDNNTANSGVGGYIFGYSNYVNKTNHPFVMGSANSAYNGNWFKVIGEQNTMSGGEDMHAIGYRNENRGYNNTYFIGHGLKARNNDGYYVGCWNAGKNSNTVFEIGYGSSDSNRKTLFLIDRNGNVSAAGTITTGVTMTANS